MNGYSQTPDWKMWPMSKREFKNIYNQNGDININENYIKKLSRNSRTKKNSNWNEKLITEVKNRFEQTE